MRYIRFLKVPKSDGHSLSALITITSDLGDEFLPTDIALAASIRSPDHDGDIFLRKSVKWTAGMRALPVNFDIRHCDLDWPVVLHVGPKSCQVPDGSECQNNSPELPLLVSVWSSPLDVPAGIKEAKKQVQRCFIPPSNRTLSIWEETGDSIACHIWDAGVGLAMFFEKTIAMQYDNLPLLDSILGSATYKTLHVLELGTGCGIVGISLAQTIPDCDVTLTDLPEAREIAQKNIDEMNAAMSSRATFVPLDWGRPLPQAVRERHHDMIIVSDCTYNPDSNQDLVDTLKALVARSPKAIVVLAMKVRHENEAVFFDLMRKGSFVQASKTCLSLPRDEAESRSSSKIDIYVFHPKTRSCSVDGIAIVDEPSVVSFWQA